MSSNKKLKFKSKRDFTLLELICVLAISVLTIGITVGRVGKTPAFVSLKNCALRIESVLSEASRQALITGNEVSIQYENKKFAPIIKDPSNAFYATLNKYLKYTLPEFVEIDFPGHDKVDNILFIFYPDGSASAPEIKLNLKAHSAILKISKLTGVVYLVYE